MAIWKRIQQWLNESDYGSFVREIRAKRVAEIRAKNPHLIRKSTRWNTICPNKAAAGHNPMENVGLSIREPALEVIFHLRCCRICGAAYWEIEAMDICDHEYSSIYNNGQTCLKCNHRK